VQAFPPPPAQHSSPRLPHAAHVPAVHRAPDAVQVIGAPPPMPPSGAAPPQQGWLTAPQVAPLAVLHDPLLHVPVVPLPVQVAPLAMHMPPTQQPPLLQLFAAQQACPAAPQLVPTGVVGSPVPLPPLQPAAPNRNTAAAAAARAAKTRPPVCRDLDRVVIGAS
jgi:hypothetical protein